LLSIEGQSFVSVSRFCGNRIQELHCRISRFQTSPIFARVVVNVSSTLNDAFDHPKRAEMVKTSVHSSS
jgi:hypothetical protein